MGNSPSKKAASSSFLNNGDAISKPRLLSSDSSGPGDTSTQAVAGGGTSRRGGLARRLTSPSSNRAPSSPSNIHRRTRSAQVPPPPPPPPYSALPGSSDASLSIPPQNGNHHGSSHTRVFAMPSMPTVHENRRSVSIEHAAQAAAAEWTVTGSSSTSSPRPVRRNSVENALDSLRKYNTVLIVDDSSSMEGAKWTEARNALAALADIAAKYDTDGIDVCFLNHRKIGQNMINANAVQRLFDSVRPNGHTPIGERLEELLLYYLNQLDEVKAKSDDKGMRLIKPVNYIVITDGAPTDDPEEVIVTAARRLDNGHFPLTQVGIQFVQIGNSPRASAFLEELDNSLAERHGIRDIVDTTPYTGGSLDADTIIKILLGGINRRVDRRGGGSVM